MRTPYLLRVRRNKMRSHFMTGFTLLAVWLLAAGCEAADTRSDSGARYSIANCPATVDAPTVEGLRDQQTKDKDKRGNTPPGTDRSGGGPASGAILDPGRRGHQGAGAAGALDQSRKDVTTRPGIPRIAIASIATEPLVPVSIT
jgi:hypothetical protein